LCKYPLLFEHQDLDRKNNVLELINLAKKGKQYNNCLINTRKNYIFMKYLLFIILLFSSLFTFSQSLFDDTILHEIRITSTEDNLWDLLSSDYEDDYPNVPYRSVTIEVDGNILEEVGVRQKGLSSHFLCSTDKFP
jgi:hypothetical protein